MRRERSLEKEAVEGERAVRGVRDSFVMVLMMPRWSEEETSVWNAVCSSWEALKTCQFIEEDGGREGHT